MLLSLPLQKEKCSFCLQKRELENEEAEEHENSSHNAKKLKTNHLLNGTPKTPNGIPKVISNGNGPHMNGTPTKTPNGIPTVRATTPKTLQNGVKNDALVTSSKASGTSNGTPSTPRIIREDDDFMEDVGEKVPVDMVKSLLISTPQQQQQSTPLSQSKKKKRKNKSLESSPSINSNITLNGNNNSLSNGNSNHNSKHNDNNHSNNNANGHSNKNNNAMNGTPNKVTSTISNTKITEDDISAPSTPTSFKKRKLAATLPTTVTTDTPTTTVTMTTTPFLNGNTVHVANGNNNSSKTKNRSAKEDSDPDEEDTTHQQQHTLNNHSNGTPVTSKKVEVVVWGDELPKGLPTSSAGVIDNQQKKKQVRLLQELTGFSKATQYGASVGGWNEGEGEDKEREQEIRKQQKQVLLEIEKSLDPSKARDAWDVEYDKGHVKKKKQQKYIISEEEEQNNPFQKFQSSGEKVCY